MIVVLAGAPGAGKGTHAARVAEVLDVPHVSTGDLLRGAVDSGTELGKKAESYMKGGELVPDDIMLSLVAGLLDSPEWERGVVLDGFPRTLPQAHGFDALLKERGRPLGRVLLFDLSEEAAVDRLSSRMWCPKDSSIYNLKTNPPATDGVCDVCGGPLERRADDEPETIRARFVEFRSATGPMIDYYKDLGALTRVSTEGPIEDVSRRVREAAERLTAGDGVGDGR